MRMPVLRAWIVQGNFLLSFGINACLIIQFEAITANTSEAEIVEDRFTPCAFGDDVVDFHRHDNNLPRLAVFTASIGTLNDLLP